MSLLQSLSLAVGLPGNQHGCNSPAWGCTRWRRNVASAYQSSLSCRLQPTMQAWARLAPGTACLLLTLTKPCASLVAAALSKPSTSICFPKPSSEKGHAYLLL